MQVSVIIPVYNAATYVTQAVESALAQPETGQVILVEDGSSDDSLEVCRRLAAAHERVELYQHACQCNQGVAASRNLGIAAVRCPYTAFLDADDFYLPGRFAVARRIFESRSDIDGVYDAIGTSYEDNHVGQWYRDEEHPELLTLTRSVEPEQLFEMLVSEDCGYFCTDGIVVRTPLFLRTGGFDRTLAMGEDTAMWIKMAVMGRLAGGCLDRPVGMRRLHENNTIYQRREHNVTYAVQMAKSLLNWGRGQRLPMRRMILLSNWLLNFQLEDEGPNGESYVRRKCRHLRFLTSFATQHPSIVLSRHYWQLVCVTLGARWLMGMMMQYGAAGTQGEVT